MIEFEILATNIILVCIVYSLGYICGCLRDIAKEMRHSPVQGNTGTFCSKCGERL